jgi:hypothetical protein
MASFARCATTLTDHVDSRFLTIVPIDHRVLIIMNIAVGPFFWSFRANSLVSRDFRVCVRFYMPDESKKRACTADNLGLMHKQKPEKKNCSFEESTSLCCSTSRCCCVENKRIEADRSQFRIGKDSQYLVPVMSLHRPVASTTHARVGVVQ